MKALPYQAFHNRYVRIKDRLTEKSRRLWAGSEAPELGCGGVRAVARATGLSPITIQKGMEELAGPGAGDSASGRQRGPGGGRKALTAKDPALADAPDKLMEPCTGGDPMRPLRWTCKSTGQLARGLTRQGHPVSADTVGRLLKAEGYSLQGNRKRFEGKQHSDRNAWFEYIADTVEAVQSRDCPTISVDTKKKEPVGNYLNRGQEWTLKGEPVEVEAY
ncbi:MAG: hypothetical protein JWM59_2951 [Verrucomicrobiales bacterium]|nr:hypothetical protein [Verrucomicrobiales bacterium]